MNTLPNGFPELRWKDYLLVDGWTYRSDARFLIFVKSYQVLPHVRAARVLEQIFHEDPKLCDGLLETYGHTRYLYDHDALHALVGLLGISFDPSRAEVDRFGRLLVFERKRAPPPPPRPVFLPGFRPAPLSATEAFITFEFVDDSEARAPVAGVCVELVTGSGEVRSVRSNEDGIVHVTGIAPGRAILRLIDRDGSRWRPLDGDVSAPSSSHERMQVHVVSPGECLTRIAHRYGFRDAQALWRHPRNEPLRKMRKSPHVLHPGDEVAVPSVRIYEIARPTDAMHRVEIVNPWLELKVALGDHHGRPFKQQPYELRWASRTDPAPVSGMTDGEGQVSAKVPSDAGEVLITLPNLGLSFPIAVSAVPALPENAQAALHDREVPSADTVRALQMRLHALGISSGPVNGVWSEQTQLALHWLRRGKGRTEADLLCDQDLAQLETFGV